MFLHVALVVLYDRCCINVTSFSSIYYRRKVENCFNYFIILSHLVLYTTIKIVTLLVCCFLLGLASVPGVFRQPTNSCTAHTDCTRLTLSSPTKKPFAVIETGLNQSCFILSKIKASSTIRLLQF